MRPETGPGTERVIASRRIHDGRICALREDTVVMANGQQALREIVEHADVVAIVPVDAEGNVVLVRQYRLAAGDALLEVPAGIVDEGEDVAAAAQRELQEEAGYRAERLERLAGFYVSPGFCTEFIHLFLATGLVESSLAGDPDEDITVERVPLAEALRLVESGAVRDGKSIIAILLAARRLEGGPKR
ncbi:MAG: NUDIX hydrolase [Dehalococcoidia bacterium]|nr:NUDIX hydrolase [Dehalococcoidia bacterium]